MCLSAKHFYTRNAKKEAANNKCDLDQCFQPEGGHKSEESQDDLKDK